ncbi:SH3 domain-containing protein [Ketobacter sp. MCCC 1A13808]|nr:SH3 domain-containing protein [Ketobacter sp. MCCC 1A13808]RLP54321.1 MAG: hypothetical protein D6160_11730 [Ketobacter sp.]
MTPHLGQYIHFIRRHSSPHMTVRILLIVLVFCSLSIRNVQATEYPSVKVAEPYLDLRTGPGRGYPVTQIVERGDWVEVMVRRTDWLKVRTAKGFTGWAHQNDIARTVSPDGEATQIATVSADDFAHRRWETGFKVGSFSGARTSDLYLGYYFTDNLSVEGTLGEAYGTSVDFNFLNISLTHQPWPEWRYSPYLTLGGGIKNTSYSKTAIQVSDRIDETLHAGLGLRVYLTRHLMVRGEYRSVMILTEQAKNEESDEWTIGLSAFF